MVPECFPTLWKPTVLLLRSSLSSLDHCSECCVVSGCSLPETYTGPAIKHGGGGIMRWGQWYWSTAQNGRQK
ncbi:hypothetical protein ATANTOWER_003312 [Ataeniobius toweri]|uniref:Secreted protein n=1 Tax=Ataeniobius toweri TaxID=208326 RepID=A0ABU7CHI7_9TELE|nr:hypothetical protein [Ataeniobius toweri]